MNSLKNMLLSRVILVVLLANVALGKLQFSKYFDKYVSNLIKKYPQNIIEEPDTDIYTHLKNYGYNLEFHHVTTEDGYILGVHRVPRGRNATNSKNHPPVILQHGLGTCSIPFLTRSPEKALGLVLADAGFDVWLTNNRGNLFSRNHTKLDPDKDIEFWNFSWEECGYYDVPAVIDYIHEKTGHKKVFYIGHSQGTTQFFAMSALRPEYNNRISLMTALAPVVYMQHMSAPIFKLAAQYMDVLQPLSEKLGIHELFPYSNTTSKFLKYFCSNSSQYIEVCSFVLQFLCGFDPVELDENFFAASADVTPGGMSVNMIIHYGQEVNSGYFRRYDYGEKENLKKYKSPVPPNYNLSAVTAPIALYWSQNDLFAAVVDVEELIGKLPNLVLNNLMKDKYFTHCDYLMAKDVDTMIYDNLTEFMKLYIDDDDIDGGNNGSRNISSIYLLITVFLVMLSFLYE